MERVRRRWWTWSVSILALLVILAAAVSGLFQLAVLELPSYRDELSSWVTQVAGRPVDIDGVGLVWSGIHPRLDLEGITLYSEDGNDEVLTADRLSLGFGLLRLARGDLMPDSLELSGLSLAVDVDADGHVRIIGLDASPEVKPDYARWLQQLGKFHRLRLLDCDLQVTAPQLPDTPLTLHLTQADFRKTFSGLSATAHLDLPPSYGKSMDLTADLDGALEHPADWSGNLDMQVAQLQPQPWVRRWFQPGTRAGAGNAQLDIKGRLRKGQLTQINLQLQTGPLLAAHAGHVMRAHTSQLLAQAVPAAGGWQVDIRKLAIDGGEQVRGSLSYTPLANGSGYDLNAEADLLKLDWLTPWLTFLREPTPALALAAHAGGEIDGLVLRLHDSDGQPQYLLRAMLNNFSYAAGDGLAGVSGLNGELSADESSGRLRLTGGGVTLDLPHALRVPAPFDALTGELRWERLTAGWRLGMPAFSWRLAGSQGQGTVTLDLPGQAGQSPVLDLSAQFSDDDVTRLKPFIPKVWPDALEQWLTRGIGGGRVANGVLVIHGPLADFPFHKNHSGSWKLDFDANDVKLGYHPDWPQVDGIHARLAFAGNGLDISADSGSTAGTRVETAHARIVDFDGAQLQVDATVSGEMARFYDFLKTSPLKNTLSALVDHTSASGPARVNVHLDIPLAHAEQTAVNGDVALDHVQLRYAGLSQPIRDISGDIQFSELGATATTPLSAKFEDLDLAVRILPRAGTKGVISAAFDYAPAADGSGVSGFVPELVRKTLSGHSLWNAELPLSADNTGLSLSSDLQGIAIALPPPLGKTAAQAVPLTLLIDAADKAGGMQLRVDYRDRLNADIALAPASAAAGWSLTGMNLYLGKGVAPPAGKGISISGNLADLDLGAWKGAFAAAGNSGSGIGLQRAELHVDHLQLFGQSLQDVHVVYTPNATGWSALLDGAGAAGTVNWNDAGGGVLIARLQHLHLDAQTPPTETAASATEAAPQDPAQLPLLDLRCDQLDAGDADLGKAVLVTRRIDAGQAIDTLSLSGGKTSLTASGRWTRGGGLSGAALKFDLQSQNIAALLHAFGYAPNIDAKDSHFTGDLQWMPRSEGLRWELAQGPITIDVKSGKLSAVEPGAGRVLGLLNFYALPRRLTLDFRDVVSSGLAFDTITGGFDLADGQATTGNLDIAGPSLRMEVRGRVGLIARDFDQTVKVYPDVSSGVTLGAALLGGPAVGALVLIAQQVLNKPLEKLTQLDYHVTGSWDNPKIDKP
ncbi:MAG: YhdP family protein [Stenotrophobium sp.]